MISQDAQNRYRRERYARDPEYRERRLEQNRARNQARAAMAKRRYRRDEDFRAQCIERTRRNRAEA